MLFRSDAGSREQRMAVCDGGRACDGVAVISSDPPLMMVAAHGRGDVMVVRGPAGCRLPGPGITVYHGNIILSCQIDSTLSKNTSSLLLM